MKKILVSTLSLIAVSLSTQAAFAGEVSVKNTYTNGTSSGNTQMDITNTESHIGTEWTESIATKTVNENSINYDDYTQTHSQTGGGYHEFGYDNRYYYYGGNFDRTYVSLPVTTTNTYNGNQTSINSNSSTTSSSGSTGTYNSLAVVDGVSNSSFNNSTFSHETSSSASNF